MLLALCAPAALAGPSAYVHTPIVEYSEHEIELKGGRAKLGDGSHEDAYAISYGLGVTPWWFTEVYVKFAGATGQPTKAEAVEWENVIQLTEIGKYAADFGMLVEIERPRDHAEGYELTYGPLMQTEFGRVQLNTNVLFRRHVRATKPSATEMLYEWQVKYRWLPAFEPGFQGFGEMGKWDHWEASILQSHIVGPALFGKIQLGGRQALKYDAALLFAASPAAPDRTLRFRLEYEF
ncbi:MAG: hypothetical protein ABI423_02260 [Burkholderiales bacterium]